MIASTARSIEPCAVRTITESSGAKLFISPIKSVDASNYPTDLAKKEAAQVAGASAVVYDGSDTLPAGAPDMGAMLQDVVQGKDATSLLSTFNTGVKSAWANEQ